MSKNFLYPREVKEAGWERVLRMYKADQKLHDTSISKEQQQLQDRKANLVNQISKPNPKASISHKINLPKNKPEFTFMFLKNRPNIPVEFQRRLWDSGVDSAIFPD